MSSKYYQCMGTGLLFPADYLENWGRDGYGIGLGDAPVSECLETDYVRKVARPANLQSPEQIMYPLACPKYPIQLVIMDKPATKDQMAVLARDDVNMVTRAKIIRDKQLANPNGLLKAQLN